MNTKKAIKILSSMSYNDQLTIKYDIEQAIKLGIKALKRIDKQKNLTIPIHQPPLPGEDMV